MASRITLKGNPFKDYLGKFENVTEGALMEAVENGLKAAKLSVNEEIEEILSNKANLPKNGKYSDGTAIDGIDQDFEVKWDGSIGRISVGFDWYELGIEGQVLIYGIPGQEPVKGLKNAIMGSKAQKIVDSEVIRMIEEAIEKGLG